MSALRALSASAFAILFAGSLQASPFYEGKTITIVVGYTAGGGYDLLARFYARHLPDALDGHPAVIVQNKPGAGGLVAADYVFNAAPRDGTTLGIVGGGTLLEPILGNPQARFDSRQFGYVGGSSGDSFLCTIWHTVPVKTIEDARAREVVVGATGPGSRLISYPYALNELAGTKFKVVMGYPGGNEVSLAMEKGEVQGYCGWALSAIRQRAQSWIREKKINFIAQFALRKDPQFPDVPLAIDLASTPDGKRAMEFLSSDAILAWPLIAPPNLPPGRLAEIRSAFDAVTKNSEAIADASRQSITIDPISGDDMTHFVERLYGMPAAVIGVVKRITQAQ